MFNSAPAARKAAREMAGEDLTKYRWIMYMHHPMGEFEIMRTTSLNDSVSKLRSYGRDVFEYERVTASLYPYSAEDWAEAEDYRKDGCPLDYPSKLIEFGPRGGARITSA